MTERGYYIHPDCLVGFVQGIDGSDSDNESLLICTRCGDRFDDVMKKVIELAGQAHDWRERQKELERLSGLDSPPPELLGQGKLARCAKCKTWVPVDEIVYFTVRHMKLMSCKPCDAKGV